MYEDLYTGGGYAEMNPSWHVEESQWKAEQILHMLGRNGITPKTICEVGCGAGEVLKQLQDRMDAGCAFVGYDISPRAIALCQTRANARLQCRLADIRQDPDAHYDLMLLLDVVEHVEDYFGLLRGLRPKAAHTIFHLPLDVSVQSVLRPRGLLKTRAAYGHIHYFTKEIALQLVRDAGYRVLDHVYTRRSLEMPTHELPKRLMRMPRKLLFALDEDVAARILGGFSLLILAQ